IPIDNSLLTDFQEVEKLEVENQEVGFQEVENQPLLNTDVNQVLNKPNIDYNQILREEREGATPLLPPSSQIDESFLKIKTYFEQHIRPTTYRDAQDINKLLEFYKDADLIIEAIKIALDRGKPFINYIDGILKRWSVEQGINSYQDFLTKGGNYDATSGAQNRPNTSTFAGADEEFMRGLSKFSTK
ncbi:MAG: DnaD domain protein, partial [Metasolibacillus sp.]